MSSNLPEPTSSKLPRWRGFNLQDKFTLKLSAPFREHDFQWISDWGFNFVRIPMDYRCWSPDGNPDKMDEECFRHLDQVLEFGEKYSLHINFNFHRAPGYCVNPPEEAKNLWQEEEAQDIAAKHWAYFAKRYKGRPNKNVSFDLFNEPAKVEEPQYALVVRKMLQAIRAEDAGRLVIVDGLNYGNIPVASLAQDGVGQSCRGYTPIQISHFRAPWIEGHDQWDEPTWPLKDPPCRKESLWKDTFQPWKDLEAQGVGIHVGEWGAFQKCPRAVAMAWMKDCLDLWKQAGWGWSLWNFRGHFGILDSGRQGVDYEDFHGHKLDREMLNLLQEG